MYFLLGFFFKSNCVWYLKQFKRLRFGVKKKAIRPARLSSNNFAENEQIKESSLVSSKNLSAFKKVARSTC